MEAKSELLQQIFTKTITMQVWRPEHERAGRHFVYTTRYARFFVELLEKTKDRTNLDSLARYVKKKQSNFIDHSKLCDFIRDVQVKVSTNLLIEVHSLFFRSILNKRESQLNDHEEEARQNPGESDGQSREEGNQRDELHKNDTAEETVMNDQAAES